MTRLPAIMTIAALGMLAGCGRGAPAPAPETVPPAVRLPALAKPTHYALTITPNLPAATFAGEERIDIEVPAATTRIVLNAAEITFGAVTIESAARRQQATVSLDANAQTATFTVTDALAPGPARISLTYTGRLNSDLRGLYLSEANGRRYAVSQLEATDARRMFPSFDEPALKATFDLTAIVSQGDHAISNGAVRSDVPGPGAGQHTITFATTPRMSTYLVALAVGDFECTSGAADGIPIRVCATPDKRALTTLALHSAESILRYYDEYFGIRYPYGKLDVVALPDFAAGAMENTAAIFYRERLLLADAEHASLDTRQFVMRVLAHEMAHQWFGDLVTMNWWNDIWLNEGFATWMQTKPMKALEPGWHMDLAEVLSNIKAMGTDQLGSTRPIRNPADTPQQITEAFDAIAYEKGAAVLRMVEAYVGEEPFRQGINAYLQKFAYGNASAEDFWTTVAASTGKPVDRIMSTFVTQPGVPSIALRAACSGGTTTVSLTQSRYHLLGAPATAETSSPWSVPVCVRVPNGAPGTDRCQLMESGTAAMTIPGCQAWVMGNADSAGYYLAAYGPDALQAIGSHLDALSEPERLSVAVDAWAAVQAGQSDIGAVLSLVPALATDRTSGVMNVLTMEIQATADTMATPAALDGYRAWVRSVFAPVLARLGWTPGPNEPDDTRALRADVIGVLGGAGGDRDVRSRARALVDAYLSGTGTIDPTLATTVVDLAAASGDAALYDRYLERFTSTNTPEEKDRFLRALGLFEDPALVARTVDLALSPKVRTQDAGTLLAAVLASPHGWTVGWPLVRDRWNDVGRRLDPFFGMTTIVEALGAVCDARAVPDLREFFRAHAPTGAARTLRQSLERMTSCAAVRQAQGPALETWLNNR
jgi:aminopeptidase N